MTAQSHPAIGFAIERIVDVLGSKGEDYSLENDPWSNFRATAAHLGIEIYEAADFNEVQKLARLQALRQNGSKPRNEAIVDTYMDKAVYAVLAYAMYLSEHDLVL